MLKSDKITRSHALLEMEVLMKQEQLAYIQARKLETFFREKVDLQYKGQNGRFSEYDVTQVNNRSVRSPITVGISETSAGAKLYLSADLTKLSQGAAKIEFDLSGDTLRGLETGRHKITFLDALQAAVSNRYLTSAEDIAGQSLLRSIYREYQKTILNPFHQLRDLFRFITGTMPGGPFGKPLGDSIKQAKPMHIKRNTHYFGRANFGLRNTTKQSSVSHPDAHFSPIIVRPETILDSTNLSSRKDYELSFSRDCSRGVPHSKCTLTPVKEDDLGAAPLTLDYDGLRLTDRGMELYLSPEQTITFSFSDRNREQNSRDSGSNHNKQQKQFISPDQKAPSQTVEKNSLDSLIASAQVRVREQGAQPSIQQTRTGLSSPDR